MGYQLEKIHIWFYRIFSFIFNSFISVSDAVKKEIEKREWVNPQKIRIIHNGIKMDLYSNMYNTKLIKKELGIDPSKIIIGMVASFRPVKGQIYLVEAIGRIIQKHKKKILVVIAGQKETEYFRTVKKRIDELDLKNYFVFTGKQQDIPRLLSIFDVFVLSSITEGFSNAILEAMAAGKPVVAPHSGGNPEAVEHKRTGLLFKPCDSQSLAEALQQLIENKNLRISMGKEGRLRVKQDFQINEMVNKNEVLYQYHLNRHPNT